MADLITGGVFRSRHLPGLVVAGAWSLATFVLVQAYSSTLISFVTTPISTPLVKSPEDLVRQTHVHLIVRINYATETILTVRIYFYGTTLCCPTFSLLDNFSELSRPFFEETW